MTVLTQEQVGRCSFIDVLEEAVLRKRPVAVRLEDGSTFIDEVVDVVTEHGDDYAVFRSHPRVSVGLIRAATRAEPLAPVLDVS
jgi:Rho-binding antiterminator